MYTFYSSLCELDLFYLLAYGTHRRADGHSFACQASVDQVHSVPLASGTPLHMTSKWWLQAAARGVVLRGPSFAAAIMVLSRASCSSLCELDLLHISPYRHPHEPLARWLVPRFGIASHNYCTVLVLFQLLAYGTHRPAVGHLLSCQASVDEVHSEAVHLYVFRGADCVVAAGSYTMRVHWMVLRRWGGGGEGVGRHIDVAVAIACAGPSRTVYNPSLLL